jgi:type IV secretory pathway component VirB8
MDALPPAAVLHHQMVTPEVFDDYCREAESYRADRIRDTERERDRARWLALAGLVVGMAGVAIAGVVSLRSHPEGWIMAYDSSSGRVGIVQRIDRTALPPPVDNWLMANYVELREGYNVASEAAAFNAVACLSEPTEQARYAAWFNEDQTSPSQLFAHARNHGFRTATATSDPIQVGTGPNDSRRVQVRFEYRDTVGSDTPPRPVTGTATFTVRKDRKAIAPCNPAGLVISDYERSIDKGASQ